MEKRKIKEWNRLKRNWMEYNEIEWGLNEIEGNRME